MISFCDYFLLINWKLLYLHLLITNNSFLALQILRAGESAIRSKS